MFNVFLYILILITICIWHLKSKTHFCTSFIYIVPFGMEQKIKATAVVITILLQTLTLQFGD